MDIRRGAWAARARHSPGHAVGGPACGLYVPRLRGKEKRHAYVAESSLTNNSMKKDIRNVAATFGLIGLALVGGFFVNQDKAQAAYALEVQQEKEAEQAQAAEAARVQESRLAQEELQKQEATRLSAQQQAMAKAARQAAANKTLAQQQAAVELARQQAARQAQAQAQAQAKVQAPAPAPVKKTVVVKQSRKSRAS